MLILSDTFIMLLSIFLPINVCIPGGNVFIQVTYFKTCFSSSTFISLSLSFLPLAMSLIRSPFVKNLDIPLEAAYPFTNSGYAFAKEPNSFCANASCDANRRC